MYRQQRNTYHEWKNYMTNKSKNKKSSKKPSKIKQKKNQIES